MTEINDYTKDIEDLFLTYFISDPELFVRCMGIINPKHFDNFVNSATVKFMLEHAQKYTTLPSLEQIHAVKGKELFQVALRDEDKQWFLDEYETFARHKEMALIIYDAPEMLEEHKYGEVESLIKDAVSIGLVKDLGTDYFSNPKERLEYVANSRGATSTGWRDVDDKLYGGLNRGEITIFAGQSGAGKSLFLQNMGINWAKAGLNVVYLSLELSESLSAMRIDAMLADINTKDVLKNMDDVAMKVSSFQKKHKGNLRIKQLKNGCTANDIKAYIKELEIQTDEKIDAILLDYLDLCMPTNIRVSPSDLFVKDKYVTENLRDLAVELDVLFVTASQLNRASHEEVEFDHSHISGGISKINTADNVIAIFTTSTMKENGRYQIQFMKTRSSSGVGSKVDLGFNNRTLRIYDLEEGAESANGAETRSVMDRLKQQSVVRDNKSSADVLQRGADLRSMLKKLD